MLINWLLYPLLLGVASAGHGLLVRRFARGPSDLLLLPVGFASLIVLTTMCMVAGLHSVAWLGIVVPALAGFALGREDVRAWRHSPRSAWLWPAGAAFGAFAVFAMPVVLSGHGTWTGFTMITDIANHFDLTAQLVKVGRVHPNPVDSSYAESLRKLLDANYPIGMHSLLGASSELLGRELAFMYQPTIAMSAPMGALAAFGVLRWVGLPSAMRALGAVVIVMPNLLYAYGLVAGFKELFGAMMILITLALLIDAFHAHDRRIIATALPVAAGIDVFTVTIAPWLGVLLMAFFLANIVRSGPVTRGLLTAHWAIMAVLAGALAWPLFPSIRSGANVTASPGLQQLVTSQTDLGNLAAPLDPLTSVGIWLTGDYRYPLSTHVDLTHGLVYLVLGLCALGLASAYWKRRPEIVAVALSVGVTMIFVLPRVGTWIDTKVFAVTGVLVLTMAFFGVGALFARRATKPLAWILGIVVSAGVLYGNALAIHNATLAPEARIAELEMLGHRFAGQGPALAPAFDEYAEYFLRNLETTGRVNPPHGFGGEPPQFGADVDQISLPFIENNLLLVVRRNPTRSRPPSNFSLVYRGRFYDVWRRHGTPADVIVHVPLSGPQFERPVAGCRALAKNLASYKTGDHLVWVIAHSPDAWVPTEGTLSPNWPPDPAGSGARTHGPGRAFGHILLQRSGRYEIWQTGSFERPVQLSIDGKRIGTLEGLSDYPAEAVYVTTISLTKGAHAVQARRGGGSLRPGNGDATLSRYVGPMYFERTDDPGGRMFTTPVSEAFKVCRSSRILDWVEVVPKSSPA